MSPKVKDRIISGLISAGAGAVAVILAFKLNSKDLNAREISKRIDNKLDKTEYVSDQRLKWNDHQKVHDKDQDDMKYVRNKVDKIYDWLLNQKK